MRVGRLDSRRVAKCVCTIILAWNAAATCLDDVPAGGTTGVDARDNMAITNEATKTNEEVGCDAATVATEWDGGVATAACNAAAAGQDAAPGDI